MDSLCMNPQHRPYLPSSSCGCFHPPHPEYDATGVEIDSATTFQTAVVPITKPPKINTAGQSNLACHTCRRRKVKCDKTVPSCQVCLKYAILCAYPTTQQKPGPKIGSVSCSKRRRTRLHSQHSSEQVRHDDNRGHDLVRPMSSGSEDLYLTGLYTSAPDFAGGFQSSIGQLSHTRSSPDYGRGIQQPRVRERRAELAQILPETIDSGSEPSQSSPGSTVAQSWILHSFHEDQEYIISSNTEELPAVTFLPSPRRLHTGSGGSGVQSICQKLYISPQNLSKLTNIYFENVTSLSMFHRPTFDSMVYNTLPSEQSVSLLAAMCAISAHYVQSDDSKSQRFPRTTTSHLKSQHFYKIACATIQEQLESHGENKPPVCLLQALILTSLYECIVSAKGRSWMSLGVCVRIAHELELHLTDNASQGYPRSQQKVSPDVWTRKEEVRRAWWILWQLDIFVSTVRQRPTLIHAAEHATLLPVSDKHWYSGEQQPSCFLDLDPFLRSRKLAECGNESGIAWYIVAISLARDAHEIASPTARLATMSAKDKASGVSDLTDRASAHETELSVLENCLSCYRSTLPPRLAFHGEYLPFCPSEAIDPEHTISQDCDKQLIHSMINLAKLMIYHHSCTRRLDKNAKPTPPMAFEQPSNIQKLRIVLGFNIDAESWNKYTSAAEQVVRVLRNAGPHHIRYGHPLLPSTFWIVAAVQLFQLVFAEDEMQRQLAQSNFDLLRLALIQHNRFWNTSDTLINNLDTLQRRLDELSTGLMNSSRSRVVVPTRSNHLPRTDPETHGDRFVDLPHFQAADGANVSLADEDFDWGRLEDKVGSIGTSYPNITSSPELPPVQEEFLDDRLSAFMHDFCGDGWDAWQHDLQNFFSIETGVV